MPVDLDRLRKSARCVYIAVEKSVADDISEQITNAADEIERLRAENKALKLRVHTTVK